MKLEVPYYSQFLDVSDAYWSPRACGFCCVKMVLDFYNIEGGSISELAKEAEAKGGFGKSGLKHDYVVNLFKSFGLNANREEKMHDEEGLKKIKKMLEERNPVIVSVIKRVLGQNKFHQVVLTGFEADEGGAIKGFYFNDPENLYSEDAKDKFVTLNDFSESWRRMAIFIQRK